MLNSHASGSETPSNAIRKVIRRYSLWALGGILSTLCVVGAALIPPEMAGRIVDEVFRPVSAGILSEEGIRLLRGMVLTIIAAAAVRGLFIYLRNFMLEEFSQRVIRDLKLIAYDHIQKQSMGYFHQTPVGDIMSRMTTDFEMLRALLVFWVMHGVTGITYITAAVVILLPRNHVLALMAVAVTPFLFLSTLRFRRTLFPRIMAIRKQFAELNSRVQESISGIRLVKAFMRYDHELETFEEENSSLSTKRNRALRVWATFMPLIEFLAQVPTALVLLAGGWMIIRGRISLGLWVQFNGYLWMLTNPMRMLGELANQSAMASAAVKRINELLNSPIEISNPPQPLVPESVAGRVEFQDVVWEAGDIRILDGINLVAQPGSTIGIMGSTGSGKTMMMNLIPRFIEPSSGRILVDGIDTREWDLTELRRIVALVDQEPFLFSDTMYSNLTYGRSRLAPEIVLKVAMQTQAHMFIESMSDGYETVVGERGTGLSGGQKQRASLTRALIKESPILILDDSTSAVDSETEKKIQDSVKDISGGVTTFIVSHRISSVRHADEIVVLEAGRIIERGRHEELMEIGGRYAQAYGIQYGTEHTDGA